MIFSVLIFIFSLLFILFSLVFFIGKNLQTRRQKDSVKKVKDFYNETTDKFLEVYGEIIQAYRTKDVNSYLNYTAENMLLEDGMKLLDAGCGVGGPAVFFAKKFQSIRIDACSISNVQIDKAKDKVLENNVALKVFPKVCDYHTINEVFENETYDRVYFLESFGHSSDKSRLLHAAWDVLKPGGKVYIKDLFKREVAEEWEQHYIDKICKDIDRAYEYHIGTLYETLSILRKKGYTIKFIKTPEVALDEFEHLSISNEFQELFNIGKIDSWDEYVFPIDFFEILAEKPVIPSEEARHLYFLNKQ
jgi:cyclopropane fatty-acyl-phospholipid synthase-like methyltransferase